jgi:acylphosphatase
MATTGGSIRRRVRIVGRVHGVGFRESCRREACVLGVAGTVRNLADESVEAVFEGPAPLVEQMLSWCHHGPRMAHVRHVEVTTEAPTGSTGFTIGYW